MIALQISSNYFKNIYIFSFYAISRYGSRIVPIMLSVLRSSTERNITLINYEQMARTHAHTHAHDTHYTHACTYAQVLVLRV